MEMQKVMVKEGDVAIITCPFCRKNKKLSVGQYKENGKRELRIKCSCDKVFRVCLECRRHYRKPTKLLGKTINLSNHREQQDVIIKNISSGGIGFCAFKKHKTRENDRLHVSFNLNDVNLTAIDTQVTVRSAYKDYIGCEFNSKEKFKTPLGFYLIS
ncbi:PilZ domain-containing protein [Thermodesulfobacteriota bacterium]